MNLAIKNQENSNTQSQYTFSPTPNWLLRRKEISHGGKHIYGQLCQYSCRGKNSIYPSRERLADDLGMSIRAVDRFIKELASLNLIQVIRNGKTLNNSYKLLPHIWMKDAPVYASPKPTSDSPKVATSDSPKVATPYKDKEISVKDNIIHNKNNNFSNKTSNVEQIDKQELQEKFEEWWKAYPKKLDRRKAKSAFALAMKKTDFETLIKKARAYARMRNKITENKPDQEIYTKYAHRWLAEFCWEDDYGKNEIETTVYSKAPAYQYKPPFEPAKEWTKPTPESLAWISELIAATNKPQEVIDEIKARCPK